VIEVAVAHEHVLDVRWIEPELAEAPDDLVLDGIVE
jgi:hypothetical protein